MRSSHFRTNPKTPIWATRDPLFLVSIGQAVCGSVRGLQEARQIPTNDGTSAIPQGVSLRIPRISNSTSISSTRRRWGGTPRLAEARSAGLIPRRYRALIYDFGRGRASSANFRSPLSRIHESEHLLFRPSKCGAVLRRRFAGSGRIVGDQLGRSRLSWIPFPNFLISISPLMCRS